METALSLVSAQELPSFKFQYERTRFIPFCRRMYPGYLVAPHLDALGNALEAVLRRDIRNLAVMMPPRRGKSLTASEHFPPFFLGNCPDERIIACSYSDRLARRFSRQARRKLTDPRWPFPEVRPSDDSFAASAWDLSPPHKGGYVAAGVGGSITGMGADLLLIDDPVKNAEEADSEIMRENVWDWFTTTATTRLEPGGRTIIIMTRWHEDDLLGRVLNTEGGEWTVLSFPEVAGDDDPLGREPGEHLWPERYPPEEVEAMRQRIGPRAWNALFQQTPIDDEGAMFPRDAWGWYGPRDLPPLTEVAIAVDSAFKEGVGSDYSVFAAWGHDGHGRYYLLDLWRNRVEFPALILAGHAMYAKWKHAARKVALVVEDKASGQSAIQVWRKPYAAVDERDPSRVTRYPAIPVIAFPVSAGQSKVARADGITHVVHSHQSFLPVGQAWTAEFVQEHVEFPLGAHDDQVDSTSIALTHFLNPPKRGFRTY